MRQDDKDWQPRVFLLALAPIMFIGVGLALALKVYREMKGFVAPSWTIVAQGAGALALFTAGLILAYLLVALSRVPRRSSPILRVPGGGLRRWADLWFSKKVCGLVFDPILSDLQVEYFEALAAPDPVKARFVLIRGYGAFWFAFVAQLPVSLAKVVVELWIASKG